jgi:hypothetical protein
MEAGFKANDEAALRHYLLGELSEAERKSVEERLFGNDQYSEHLSLVEDDLIDSYVRGELQGGERAHFESHFLSSPRRRERVSFARAWLVPEPRSGVLPMRKVTRPWAGAVLPMAAMLLVLLAGSMMVSFNSRLTRQREESAALGKQIEELRSQAVSRKDASSDLQALAHTSPPQAAPPLSFILLPGMQRGATRQEQRLLIPAGRNSVELDLVLTGAKQYRSYRVAIQNPDGAEVWGKSQVAPSKDQAGAALRVSVPSLVLKEGDYRVLITGVGSSGELEELNDYYVFHVAVR